MGVISSRVSTDWRLQFVCGNPLARREDPHQHLHVDIASHGNLGRIIRKALEWVVLEGYDTTSHAETSLPHDGDATTEVLPSASAANDITVFIGEHDNVVKTVAANVVRAFDMVLPARGAANVNGCSYHHVSGVMEPLLGPVVGGQGCL